MPDPISWQFYWPYLLAAFAGGYLVGSIPFALVVTWITGQGDIRKQGSGNPGTTNVLRVTGSKVLTALTLILDSGKGAAVTLAAWQFGPDIAVTAAGASILGHCFPVWLGFKGGKGVATTLGVLLAISWPVGLAALATWIVAAAITRFSSVGALASVTLAPVYAWYLADPQRAELAVFLSLIVWIRHHRNIRNLIEGKESRIRLRRS